MTREQREAHLRMISFLPVRTVKEKEHREDEKIGRPRRVVEIKGKVYESLTEAARSLKVSPKVIYRMARHGTAPFLSSGMQDGSENSMRLA